MLTITGLYIYPIKSLGGIPVGQAALTDRGFEHDRRWMLVDAGNRFLSQREVPQMALLRVELHETGLILRHIQPGREPLFIAMEPEGGACMVDVWGDRCRARYVSAAADEWFSAMLAVTCRLVYMPDATRRRVDGRYAFNKEITSFADGYPLLLIGQASLDDLNSRLAVPVPMDRFRPNIVFEGGEPYQEDEMKHFEIAGISFSGVKRCARCVITTIDQDTMAKGKEPLRTLNSYRRKNNKIYFGQNLLFRGTGTIATGDLITIA